MSPVEQARTDVARLAAARAAAWETDPGNLGMAHTIMNAYGYSRAYYAWAEATERLRLLEAPPPAPVVDTEAEPENDNDEIGRLWAIFARRWPQSLQATGLRTDLSTALQGVGVPTLEQLRKHNPASGTFQAMAHWARLEIAHMNAKEHPGMWLPARLPLPKALIDLMSESAAPKKKRVTRRASK